MNCGTVCLHGFFCAIEAIEGETEVVLGFHTTRRETQGLSKGVRGLSEALLRVIGAAESVPGFGVAGIGGEGAPEPVDGVGVVVEEDVVEGDDAEVFGVRRGDGGGLRVGGEGVFGLVLAMEDEAEEVAGIGGFWIGGVFRAKGSFGCGQAVFAEEGFGLGEGVGGRRGECGLGEGLGGGQEEEC